MSDFFVQSMLQQLPYFAHAAGLTVSELAQQAVHCTFVPNETIFLEGEPSAGLWIYDPNYRPALLVRHSMCGSALGEGHDVWTAGFL